MSCSPDSNLLLVEGGGVAGDDEEQAMTPGKEWEQPNHGGVNVAEYLLMVASCRQRNDVLLTDFTGVKQAE